MQGKTMDKWDTSCEPMDIDLSINSDSAMDISYQENFIKRSPTPANKLQTIFVDDTCNSVAEDQELMIDLKTSMLYEDKIRKQNKWFNIFTSFILFTSLIFVMLSILSYVFNIKCNDELNLTLLRNTLLNRVYDQNVATENFIDALENNDDSKLLLLYGGTGVGKTLTVSLLLNSILNYTNTYHFTMPNFVQTFSPEFMLGVILCKTSIIVIDDLTIDDTEIIGIVKELLAKCRSLNKKVTIILIYNCDNSVSKLENSCDKYFVSDLALKLHDIEVYKTYVKFEPLTEESLHKCIQHEVGKPLNKNDLTKMLKNFNVHQDGCKGVHQKIKYLNIV